MFKEHEDIARTFYTTLNSLKKLVCSQAYLNSIGYSDDQDKQDKFVEFGRKFNDSLREFDAFKKANFDRYQEVNDVIEREIITKLENLNNLFIKWLNIWGVLVMNILTNEMFRKAQAKREIGDTKITFITKLCPNHRNQDNINNIKNEALENFKTKSNHLEYQKEFVKSHMPKWYNYHKYLFGKCAKLVHTSQEGVSKIDLDQSSSVMIDLGLQREQLRKELLCTKIPNLFALKIEYFHMFYDEGITKFLL